MKVNVIKANAHKYSVSAMCRVLQVNRSTYYYESKQKPDESGLASEITEIFRESCNNYGTRHMFANAFAECFEYFSEKWE